MEAAHSEIGGSSIAGPRALSRGSRTPARLLRTVVLACLALVVAPSAAFAVAGTTKPGTISTLAGNPLVGGIATSIGQKPDAVLTSHSTLYVADRYQGVVHAIDMRTDVETTVAGTGGRGYLGDGVPAAGAELNGPAALALDPAGDLLIADGANNRVRLVAATDCAADCPYGLASTKQGDIYTVAGGGTTAWPAVDGLPATEVSIQGPEGLALNGRGDLLISTRNVVVLVAGSDCSSDCPYRLTSMTKGDVYTVAGQEYVLFNPNSGGLATGAGIDPTGLAVDGAGNLLIANSIYYAGLVSMVAANDCNSDCPYGLASTIAGNIYTIAGADGSVGHETTAAGSGTPATSQYMTNPTAVQVDAQGNVLINDQNDGLELMLAEHDCASACLYGLASTIRGDMYTIAGLASSDPGVGGPAADATLSAPRDVAVDSAGDLLIPSDESSDVSFIAAQDCSSSCPFGLSSTTANDIYVVAGNGTRAFSGESGPATGLELSRPSAVASDSAGNVLILDSGSGRVRVIAATSCASACAYGLPGTTQGDMYTIAGGGTSPVDGVPARSATLLGTPSTVFAREPTSIAIDPAGDLLISDAGNSRVRLVAAADCASQCAYGLASTQKGDIYTVAGDGNYGYSGDQGPAVSAELGGSRGLASQQIPPGVPDPSWAPQGIAVDPAGDLLIADTSNERIRLLANTNCASDCPYGLPSVRKGDIYTVAGSGELGSKGDAKSALSAELHDPADVTVDADGNLLVADTGNQRVREVAAHSCSSSCVYGRASTTAGYIYPLIGSGASYNPTLAQPNGDGGKASNSKLVNPVAVTLDSAGNILLASNEWGEESVIRLVAAASCSTNCAYGLARTTKGDIYTVVGDSPDVPYTPTTGFSGDGGPATSALLDGPTGIGFDAAGDLLIADIDNDRIRLVTPASPPAVSPPEEPAGGETAGPSTGGNAESSNDAGASSDGAGDGAVQAIVIAHGSVRFTVPSRRLRVSNRGVLSLRLTLSQAATGRVKFAYAARSHGQRVTAVLATGPFSASHAGIVTLRLRLTKIGHTLLQDAGRLYSVLTVTSGSTAGSFSLELWSAVR